jgi:hypothetical protein
VSDACSNANVVALSFALVTYYIGSVKVIYFCLEFETSRGLSFGSNIVFPLLVVYPFILPNVRHWLVARGLYLPINVQRRVYALSSLTGPLQPP